MNHQQNLGRFVRALSNALSQDLQQSCDRLGLTSTQGMFLHHIWLRREHLGYDTYARDLEEYFDITHPTVSGILQRMETAGFLELRASETDRRRKSIHLTERSMAVHEEISLHIQQNEAKLTSGMTAADITEFRRLLQLAAANLAVCDNPKKEESAL